MTSRPLLILVCGCTLAGPVAAGSLNAPAAPDDVGSAMYTLEDLYQRLNAGTAGTPRSGAFVEPAAGPGGTMHTLTDIMAKAPVLDNDNGARGADVLSDKTFWGLTSGWWGRNYGKMPNIGAQNITPGTSPQAISAGYHNGSGQVAGDINLTPGNIKSGTTIFGVAGSYTGSGGTISAPFPVAKTGQATPYAGGDDGVLQKGAAWPSPRFAASNGTVTDNLTGLVWLQIASCFGPTQTYYQALASASGLANGSCNLSDGSTPGQWRLPTVKELSSLVNAGAASPALPAGHPFSGVQSTNYWSSTTYASNTSNAWVVNLYDGNANMIGKTNIYIAWPVRGGQ